MAETAPSPVRTSMRVVTRAVAVAFALLAFHRPALAGLPGTPTATPSIGFTASGGPSPTITPTATITSVIHTSPTQTPSTPIPTFPPSPTITATQTPSNGSPTPSPATPVPTLSPPPTQTGTASPSPATPSPGGTPCGNMQIDPGETCDPPGSLQPPNGNPCRPDCTYCGDAITQPSDGETCDDANSVSGCRPDRPQQALDACLNACRFPICEDPSRIQLYPDQNDVVQVHGRLMAPTVVEFEDGEFRVRIARQVCTHDTSVGCATDAQCDALSSGSTCTPNDPASTVFEQSLAGSAIDGNGKRWRYKNAAAKTDGGIYLLKIIAKTKKKICGGGSSSGARCTSAADCPQGDCLGYYVLKLKAYGTATGAVSDMQTVIEGGGYAWAVRGIWQESPKGWRLYKKSVLLDPWL